MFKAVCPHCSKEYTLDGSLLGKAASCRDCRKTFVLEDNTATHAGHPPVTAAENDSGFDLKPRSSRVLRDGEKPQIPDPALEKRFSRESGIWNVGDIVLGIYEVKPLGPGVPFAEGGVGVVHRVYHREWNIDLAVKSPKPQVFRTESGKLGYEKEAQTWIELGLHPNIVTCYLVRRIGDIPRLFAEFVPDGSLRDWIRDGRLYEGGEEASRLRILNFATQFAWGLEHAHRQKLLHLDVKPANVMMSDQTAKVTDFGLAQGMAENFTETIGAVASQPATGGMTPGYCSPEQYNAFNLVRRQEFDKVPPITFQSDIWSWAVTVLAMFHGRPPCKKGGQTARKVFEVFLKNPPDDGKPVMPASMVELLFHCFEEEPTKRPDSMEQVADRMVEIYRDVSGVPFPRVRPISATWTPESINNRAASMLDLGKPTEAVQLLTQAAEMHPWHPEVTHNQTLLAWRNGRITDLEAVERLETLGKTRSNSAVPLYTLGLVQRERGNLQSALEALERALEIEPRGDVNAAYLAVERIVDKGARCLDRFPLAPGTDDDVFVDEKGALFLTVVEASTLTVRETTTGKIRTSFQRPKEDPSRRHPQRLALSDDILRELVWASDETSIILRRVGAATAEAVFRRVGWTRFFGRSTAKPGDAKNPIGSNGGKWIGMVKDDRVDIFDRRTKEKVGDLFGHEGMITAATMSDDGRWALTGGTDRTMRLWELPSCRCLRTFTSLGGAVDAVYLDQSGLFALSLVAGGSLRLWDVSSLCLGESSYRAPLLLSLVASAEQVTKQQAEMSERCTEIKEAVRVGDYATAIRSINRAKELSGWEATRKSLDADGVWDTLSRHCVRGKLIEALNIHTFLGHHDTVSGVVLSVDGNIAASTGRDQTIRIWNIDKRRCIGVLEGHYDWVRSLAMTSDSKFVVSGSWDMSVRVWNLATGQTVRQFDEKVKSLTQIALNPQGRTVAIANGQGSVILWDVLSNEVIGRFLAHQGSVNSIRFSRDGRFFVTAGDDNAVSVWKLGSEEPVRTLNEHKAPVSRATLSLDGNQVLSADREGRIVLWNLAEGKKALDIQGHFGDIMGLSLFGDESGFVSASKDMKLRVEGIHDRSLGRVIEGHSSPILALATEISGRRLITGCDDATVNVWELHWDYGFPGWTTATPQTETVLRTLLSLYSPDAAGKKPPKVDAATTKRILLEMEYRGFGMILPEELKQTIARLLADW